MNDKFKIAVPLHKIHSWRITCRNCNNHMYIGSGAIGLVADEAIKCPKCGTLLPLGEVLLVLAASKQLCCNHDRVSDLSPVIWLDRCEEIKP